MEKVLLQVENFLLGQQEPSERMPYNEATDQICAALDGWGESIREELRQQTQTIEERYEELHKSLEYQQSFAKMVDNLKLPDSIHSLFHYRDPNIGFYGREKEMTYLDGFLDCEKPILFTAVTGPAGSGKSKFLYEYVKELADNPNWKCLFVQNRNILKGFNERYEWEYPVNLLVVIDYAGDYAELIGEWLVSLKSGKCPPKMRIVLLEREGVEKNRSDTGYQEKIFANPMWYERLLAIHSNEDIQTTLYMAGNDAMFLELPTLSDDAFKSIMADYANQKAKSLSVQEQEKILAYCKRIEKSEQGVCRPRPLILLFIVDAWVNEEKYYKWNIQQLLLKIIKRYREHWKNTLCGENKEVSMALERLVIYATAVGGWELGKPLPEFLQKDYLTLREFCTSPQKLNQLFRSVNEKDVWDGMLSPLEPDLIGELLVLDYLQDSFESEQMIAAFNKNSKYMVFLFRCIIDYAEVDAYSELFDNGLKKLLKEKQIRKMPEIYARLLAVLANEQKQEKAVVTLKYLEELALNRQYAGNEEIVLTYAEGLVNLTSRQEVVGAEKTVERLGKLSLDSRYGRNEGIVLTYAKGLFNLAHEQEVDEAEKTVEQLRKLSKDSRYAGNEEIVLTYAEGLFNLAHKQGLEGAEKTVEQLGKLSLDNRYVGNEEIVLTYAEGLVNLTREQEAEEAEKTVGRLGKLSLDSRYAGNEEIVLEYAKGLFNLANKQGLEEAEKTVEQLRKLSEDSRYAGNEEVVLVYAKGLVNLAYEQEAEEAEKTLEQLRKLSEDSRYAGNEEVVLVYAKGLTNLGLSYYMQQEFELAERYFLKAHQMGVESASVNLSYMIRRREAKNHTPDEAKEILLPVLDDKNSFVIMNMALYLAEYENDWQGADKLLITIAETADINGVIEWWSGLDDIEGLLVMTWLERHNVCRPCYTLEGKRMLEVLRGRYHHIPDWIVENKNK